MRVSEVLTCILRRAANQPLGGPPSTPIPQRTWDEMACSTAEDKLKGVQEAEAQTIAILWGKKGESARAQVGKVVC